MTNKSLTKTQVDRRKALDIVEEYDAAVVPAMGNRGQASFVDELGYVKELAKAVEKVVKILEVRVDSFSEGQKKSCEGDVFKQVVTNTERTALNQGEAKIKLEALGILDEYMDTTDVPTRSVKRK